MKNKYTDNDVDPVFITLDYKTPFKLNPYDQPYFAVRSRKERIGLRSGGFQDPFKDISAENYGVIEDDGQNPKITAELNFLKMLDLVAQRGNKYYIHKLAKLFYVQREIKGKTVLAMFAPKNDDTQQDDTQQQEKSMRRLFKRYTLPGRFWRNYYLGLYLPNDTKQKSRVQEEMIQIEEEFLGLSED